MLKFTVQGKQEDDSSETRSESSKSEQEPWTAQIRTARTTAFDQEAMIGWVARNKRADHLLNKDMECMDTTNFYHGNSGQPRRSDSVVERIKRSKESMSVNKLTGRILCWTCERELNEYGIPPLHRWGENEKGSPFISCCKSNSETLGYDTQNTANKNLADHLERHVNSGLHKATLVQIASRHAAIHCTPTSGIALALRQKQEHAQLQNIFKIAVQTVQTRTGSQQEIEEVLHLASELEVDIGSQEHSRKTVGADLMYIISKIVDDDMWNSLNEIDPYTHCRPFFGHSSDKYKGPNNTTYLLSDLKIVVSGRAVTVFNDAAQVPLHVEPLHVEPAEGNEAGEEDRAKKEEEDEEEEEEDEEEEEEEDPEIPGGSGLGLYRLFIGGSRCEKPGKKTIANFRPGRGMNYRVSFGPEGCHLGDTNDAQCRLSSVVGDGEPAVQGEKGGLMAYVRGPYGLNRPEVDNYWDLAHQLELILKELRSRLNMKFNGICSLLHWICRKSQQFFKQSSSRSVLLDEVAKSINVLRVLRVSRIHDMRFLESELKAFRNLYHMLPVLLKAMEKEIQKNEKKKRRIGKKQTSCGKHILAESHKPRQSYF